MSIAESFGRSPFAQFINSPLGRLVRVVAGVVLIGWGLTQRGTSTGIILMVVGLIPLAAGTFNLCLISALLGAPNEWRAHCPSPFLVSTPDRRSRFPKDCNKRSEQVDLLPVGVSRNLSTPGLKPLKSFSATRLFIIIFI